MRNEGGQTSRDPVMLSRTSWMMVVRTVTFSAVLSSGRANSGLISRDPYLPEQISATGLRMVF